jgi:hypothetical protein
VDPGENPDVQDLIGLSTADALKAAADKGITDIRVIELKVLTNLTADLQPNRLDLEVGESGMVVRASFY